tara:strand:- start:515 stop:784 length:270 start_codon:yes stop_codon:yes gene_type:complete
MKLTNNELTELKYHFVDRYVDNMSTEDLVEYVFNDMNKYVDSQSETEFINDAKDYWDDSFNDVVQEIKEYANSDFKKPMEDRRNNEQSY